MMDDAKVIPGQKAKLLLSDAQKSLTRLREAADQPPTVFNQDSTIQRFEFSFEISWKLMKTVAAFEGIEAGVSPRSVIRKAATIGLIEDPDIWFKYVEYRNLTVHTYKEAVARVVYKAAKDFIPMMEKLVTIAKKKLE